MIPAVQACPRAQLVAVASRDSGRAQDYASSREIPQAYGSYDELLAQDGIDCVYISAPNSEHAALTQAALDAGKHVLCEKPLATSREEGETLFAEARRADRLLMEAFMYRHHDKTRRLRELVKRGDLGEVEIIRSSFHFRVEDPSTDIRYRADLAGGALRDVGCYCTSLACYLAGSAPSHAAGGFCLSSSGVDEAFGGILAFPANAISVFDCGMQADLNIGVTVLGSEARAYVATPWYPHLAPAEIELWRDADRVAVSTSDRDPYLLEVENFCAAVDGTEDCEVTAEETLRNLDVLDRLAAAADLPNYNFEAKGSVPQ